MQENPQEMEKVETISQVLVKKAEYKLTET